MDAVIDLRNLTKSYGGRPAVHDLSLQVPRGAIYALLGDNGAGKTTTIRMLVGLLRPDAGVAFVQGLHCWNSAVALRHKLGYVPERPRFYDWMSIDELGWFTAGFHGPGYLPRYRELLARFEFDPRALLRTLSKGQYAKAGLALALAHDPEVLILDEPTSGLDLLVRREFLTSMVHLAAEGRTILLSSHQIAEVERVASHAAFLAGGRLLLSGTLDELRERLLRVQVRWNGPLPDLAPLGTLLARRGEAQHWQLVLLDPAPDALEDLRKSPLCVAFEQHPLSLEDTYCALMQLRKDEG